MTLEPEHEALDGRAETVPHPTDGGAFRLAQPLMKLRRSALMTSACVMHIPCGYPS
jgi:hypothetical protein